MRAKSRHWSVDEEAALAKAYISTSQNPVKGNNQKHHSFWKQVVENLDEQLGKESGRNIHQVSSKWKELNKQVTCFGGIYNKKKSNMASGMNDEDVLKATHMEYQKKMNIKTAFNHMLAWEIMRKFSKWSGVQTFEEMEDSSSKRARTSESNVRSFEADHMPIDPNEDDEDESEPPARPTPPPRRKGKKPVESSSTQEELLKMVNEFNAYSKEEADDKRRARAEKLRIKEMEANAKVARDQEVAKLAQIQAQQLLASQKQSELDFFMRPHDHLTGTLLKTVLAQKQEIAERWGWEL